MTYISRVFFNARQIIRLSIAMLLMSLAGCTILPEAPALQVYLLPEQAPRAAGQQVDWSLRVVTPNTSQFLSSSRIAVQTQGEEIQVYRGARWGDSLPTLVRNRLIQQFRSDGRVAAVSSDDDSLSANFELGGDLTAFQGLYRNGESEVLIRFDARLVQTSSRSILASRNFEIRQPITGKSMSEVVQAFGLASDQLSSQVLAWTLEQAGRAEIKQPDLN